MRAWSSLVLGLLLGLVQALSSSGSRLLVLTDDAAEDKSKYSKFLGDLKDRSFDITYASAKEQPQLFELGERTYDHLLVLPTTLKALGPTLTPQTLLQFAQKEGNIFLALSGTQSTPTPIVSLLLELGIFLPSTRDSIVVDHFNYDAISASEKHDVLLLNSGAPRRSDVKDYFSTGSPVAIPRPVGHMLGADSPLLASILSAPRTAYTYDPEEEAESSTDPHAVGAQLQLVSAMQARNGARITVFGSADALSDAWFGASVRSWAPGGKKITPANREFAAKVSAWAFKEAGVLRVGELTHRLAAGQGPRGSNATGPGDAVADADDINPKIYRIKNDVTYTVTLSEWRTDHWAPYTPPATDAIQLEFTMLSPYQRLALSPAPNNPAAGAGATANANANASAYTATFRLPDQHGIFNFRLNYKRPFLTPVDEKRAVTVRHFAHDEWPRSFVIVAAYPWILGIAVTVLGWLGFVVAWLYSAPAEAEMRGPRGKKVD